MNVALASSILGLAIIVYRFLPLFIPRSAGTRRLVEASDVAQVSIIVPARNEAANLPRLLRSFLELDSANLEVILVDDESSDGTGNLARAFVTQNPQLKLTIVDGQPRPQGWTGKNWACHQGYKAASGKWLLFTDADTEHNSSGFDKAVSLMQSMELDLLTATPFHRCETWWERCLGPFQLLIFLSTAAFSKPKPNRVFAIGQYLMFKRESYVRQGGHESIRESLCDDLELARKCLESGGRYHVEGRAILFRVRMYSTFQEFVNGWRRNFRLGFRHASVVSPIEIYFVIAVLTANMKFVFAPMSLLVLALIAIVIFGGVQKRFGEFSWLGAVLFPLNIAVFVWISVLAVCDLVRRREYLWRGRVYNRTAD